MTYGVGKKVVGFIMSLSDFYATFQDKMPDFSVFLDFVKLLSLSFLELYRKIKKITKNQKMLKNHGFLETSK